MLNRKRQGALRRWGGVGISLMLAIPAARVIWAGSPGYRNYWGGLVFAPLALVVGIVLLAVALFRPRLLDRSERLRGKAERMAKQAERSRPAVEKFHKPWQGGS